MCTFEKKNLVNLDKRFRLYPMGSTGLASAGEWNGKASILERLLALPLWNGLGTGQLPKEEMLVNRTRIETKRK